MVLCPLVIGYYIRHASAFTKKRALAVACGMAALFLTHLIPAMVAGLAIVLIALWVNIVVSRLLSSERLPLWTITRGLAVVAFAFVPTLILFGWFAQSSPEPINFTTGFTSALQNFPMHVFSTSSGRAGNQFLLYPAVLCLILLSIFTMRRAEWQTARGGLANRCRSCVPAVPSHSRRRLGRQGSQDPRCLGRIYFGRSAAGDGTPSPAFARPFRYLCVCVI